MKHININNKKFMIDETELIINLLNTPSLLDMSIKDWKNILELLYGKALFKTMYTILNHKINQYDISSNVNSFIYNNSSYWFDKNTRASLLALASCSEDLISLVLGDTIIEIDPNKLKEFLAKLEIYASKCYVNTQKHLKAIKELKSIEDIINYDYTIGYPEKIILNE